MPKTHGLSGTPEHRLWQAMRRRCNNPNTNDWPKYGGRGIRVCEAWNDFPTFLRDMGPRPSPAHSIERGDVNGDYTPQNCRWATSLEQANNKRGNRLLTLRGETKTLAEWCRALGADYDAAKRRLAIGWTVEDALTLPPQGMGGHRPRGSGRQRAESGVSRAPGDVVRA